jgi:glyoxylase-like metal-dependent hydrolase (beta-lactamase superfamily II)
LPVTFLPNALPAEGEVVEIADGVLWTRLPLPMRLDHVNVYILEDADGWTVVDTGFDTERSRAVWEALLSGPLAGHPVRRVVVTHHHPDHVGLAGWFRAMGAELLATRTAWLFARMLQLDEQEVPPPETLAFWRAAGMATELLKERASSRPFNYADRVAAVPLGFTRLQEGQTLEIGGRGWTVRLGQGHAPDQATLWGEDHPLVLTADQVLPRITPNLGVYPTEPEADPVGEWIGSCLRLQAAAHDDQIALPGHQFPFRGLPSRLRALVAEHRAMLDRLHHWLSEPRTAAECFLPLYGRRRMPAEVYGLALAEALGHLNHLRATGRAKRDTEAGIWIWRRA